MKRNKWILLALPGLVALSSCGIFHKDCGCPKFGKTEYRKPAPFETPFCNDKAAAGVQSVAS